MSQVAVSQECKPEATGRRLDRLPGGRTVGLAGGRRSICGGGARAGCGGKAVSCPSVSALLCFLPPDNVNCSVLPQPAPNDGSKPLKL